MMIEAEMLSEPNRHGLVVDKKKEEEDDTEGKRIEEFVTTAAVAGYTLPLGMDPDDAGRKMNKLHKKKKSKKQRSNK